MFLYPEQSLENVVKVIAVIHFQHLQQKSPFT